jgi:hypothetical protein
MGLVVSYRRVLLPEICYQCFYGLFQYRSSLPFHMTSDEIWYGTFDIKESDCMDFLVQTVLM